MRDVMPVPIGAIPEGYSHAYQGGTHDVYCNGERHIWAQGGKGWFPFKVKREGRCNCAAYEGENRGA